MWNHWSKDLSVKIFAMRGSEDTFSNQLKGFCWLCWPLGHDAIEIGGNKWCLCLEFSCVWSLKENGYCGLHLNDAVIVGQLERLSPALGESLKVEGTIGETELKAWESVYCVLIFLWHRMCDWQCWQKGVIHHSSHSGFRFAVKDLVLFFYVPSADQVSIKKRNV